jgi:hypothetical protein
MKYLCPGCDQEVKVGSSCPRCSGAPRSHAAEKKSWEQDPSMDGLDLPDKEFDYDDFVAREFGKAPHRKRGIAWYWYLIALLLLLSMILRMFRP